MLFYDSCTRVVIQIPYIFVDVFMFNKSDKYMIQAENIYIFN